jgi:hypothetical protein
MSHHLVWIKDVLGFNVLAVKWLTCASRFESFNEARISFTRYLRKEIRKCNGPLFENRDWDIIPRSLIKLMTIDRGAGKTV